MKYPLCLAFLCLASAAGGQEEEAFPPKGFRLDRYEAMMARSPFVLPTAPVEVQAVAEPDWTSDFRIVSVLTLGDEPVVLAKKISTDERIAIRRQDNALGIRLVDITMSPDPHNVSARIEMGGNEGTITYDETILSDVPRSVAPDNPALLTE